MKLEIGRLLGTTTPLTLRQWLCLVWLCRYLNNFLCCCFSALHKGPQFDGIYEEIIATQKQEEGRVADSPQLKSINTSTIFHDTVVTVLK